MKTHKKLQPILSTLLMATLMVFSMSLVFSIINHGFNTGLFALWRKAFITEYPLGLFIGFVLIPQLQKYKTIASKIISRISISLVMSAITVYLRFGFFENFILQWMKSFIIGFCIAIPLALFYLKISEKIVSRILPKTK